MFNGIIDVKYFLNAFSYCTQDMVTTQNNGVKCIKMLGAKRTYR